MEARIKMKVGGLCLAGLLSQVTNASVFDDAAFWYDGAKSGTDLRELAAGDVPDVRKVARPEDSLNQSSCVKGDKPKIVRETVTNAETGVGREQGVVRFNQSITVTRDDSGAVTKVSGGKFQSFDIPGVVSGNVYTVLMRFRPDKGVGLEAAELKGQTTTHTDYLFCVGNYNDNNSPFKDNAGIRLGLSVANPSANESGGLGCLYISTANLGYNYKLEDLGVLETNRWYDLAVTVKADQSIRIGLGTDGQAMAFATPTKNAGKTWTAGKDGEGLPIRVGFAYNNGWAADDVDPTKDWFANFKGSVAALAVWNRALGDAEIKEALGGQFPQTAPDVLRVGLDDGSSAAFAGTAAAGEVAADAPSTWRDFPAAFTQDGQSVSIGFKVSDRADYMAGLAHLLLIRAASGSGVLRVDLGEFSEEVEVGGAGSVPVYVTGKHFTAGDLTLTLTRVSGSFALDSVSLGGSWQVGYVDKSSAEFEEMYKDKDDYAVATGDFKGVSGGLNGSGKKDSVLLLRFPVSAFAAENCPHVFRYVNNQVVENGQATELDVYVNGTLRGSSLAIKDKGSLSLRLKAGELAAGENVIAVSNRIAAAKYVKHDAFSLEIQKPRRGACVIIR